MIIVQCTSGDWAEAEDCEAAVVAARTLLDDTQRANRYQGYRPTCSFYVGGRLVRQGVTYAEACSA